MNLSSFFAPIAMHLTVSAGGLLFAEPAIFQTLLRVINQSLTFLAELIASMIVSTIQSDHRPYSFLLPGDARTGIDRFWHRANITDYSDTIRAFIRFRYIFPFLAQPEKWVPTSQDRGTCILSIRPSSLKQACSRWKNQLTNLTAPLKQLYLPKLSHWHNLTG